MRLILEPKRLKTSFPAVIAVGNFDGVHLGHQALLKRLVQEARVHQAAATVIVFEPQPSEFFLGYNGPSRLMNFAEKRSAFVACQIAQLVRLPFEKVVMMQTEAFVTQTLLQELNMVGLIAGEDCRFGRDREGDISLLQTLSTKHSFSLTILRPFTQVGEVVSSSRLRRLLALGEFEAANKLLGRTFTLGGRVIRGKGHGRILGFPTANISLERLISPLQGVFAVHVYGAQPGGVAWPGVANIGYRPTVAQREEGLWLEVHLLDFQGTLYGRKLRVAFLKKLREERRFDSHEALKAQIAEDLKATRQILSVPFHPKKSLQ